MAIFSSVILLAQNASSSINANLQDTENILQNANQELEVLKDQYNNMLTQPAEPSFFNFSNIYFWLVLVGLLLLAFGLLFLLAELQNKDKSKKSKAETVKKDKEEELIEEKEVEENIEEEEPELAKESEEEKDEEEEEDFEEVEEVKPVKKSSKPIKIKVQKIK